MRLRPVEKRDFKLGHPLAHLGIIAALAHFLCHVLADAGNPGVARVGLVGNQQVQLGIFLHFHADFIQTLNRRVAGKEVLRPGSEGDNLQLRQADQRAGNGLEFADHLCHICRGAYGILRDEGFQTPHSQIIGAVQHTAVGVAPTVNQILPGFLCGGGVHTRTVEILCNQRLGRLRAEIAQKDHKRVAARGLHVLYRLQHILFVLHRHRAFVDLRTGFSARGGYCGTAALRQGNDEAVTGYGDNAQLYFRNVGQHK